MISFRDTRKMLKEIFRKENIILDLDAQSSSAALDVFAEALALQDPALKDSATKIAKALKTRESSGSTGADRVGIPHVKMAGATRMSAVIAVHQQGLDFRALDDEPVHVFFSLVRPESDNDEHVALLQGIAEVAQHQDFVSFALQATRPEQILDLLQEMAPA